MADTREMRIFAADQIEVHRDLPLILKDYSKEIIRNNPEDIVKFSREYFENILRQQGYFEEKQKRPEALQASEKAFVWRDGVHKI
jgi:hypothetical protein